MRFSAKRCAYSDMLSRHQLRFAPADKDYSDDDQDQCDDADCDDHRAGHSFDLAAEDVGGESKDRRPSKRPESIAKKKLPPRHVIGSSKDASDTAQHRDEAADDDDLAAVFKSDVTIRRAWQRFGGRERQLNQNDHNFPEVVTQRGDLAKA
jgi:hypothetical protein